MHCTEDLAFTPESQSGHTLMHLQTCSCQLRAHPPSTPAYTHMCWRANTYAHVTIPPTDSPCKYTFKPTTLTCPGCCSSFVSNRSNRVRPSAVLPGGGGNTIRSGLRCKGARLADRSRSESHVKDRGARHVPAAALDHQHSENASQTLQQAVARYATLAAPNMYKQQYMIVFSL